MTAKKRADGGAQPSTVPQATKLSKRSLTGLTVTVSDIRAAVARLDGPLQSLEELASAGAIVAMRDLFRDLQTEDLLDAMPARKLLGDWAFGAKCAVPVLQQVGSDSEAAGKPARWAVALYQTVRVLTILSAPVEEENVMLSPGCNLEVHLMELKGALATTDGALEPVVSLLQFYMEKKAEKVAQLAPAEECKLEDARTENILHFFRNLLTPPRRNSPKEISGLDRSTHVALVGACARADLFSTLSLLFDCSDNSRNLATEHVLLVAEIFALAFRVSSPRDLAVSVVRSGRRRRFAEEAMIPASERARTKVEDTPASGSVFTALNVRGAGEGASRLAEKLDDREGSAALIQTGNAGAAENRSLKITSHRTSGSGVAGGLRAALQRERSLVGGARSVVASGRWTNRYSGGFHVVAGDPNKRRKTNGEQSTSRASSSQRSASNPTGRGGESDGVRAAPQSNAQSLVSKRIVSARGVLTAHKKGARGVFQAGLETNSELLCILAAKGRPKIATSSARSTYSRRVRSDLVDKGRLALGELAKEGIDDCFPVLVPELHERISMAKAHGNVETMWSGRRSFLMIVSTMCGFQREVAVLRQRSMTGSAVATPLTSGDIQNVTMDDALAMPTEDISTKWEVVEKAIDTESFRIVFESVIDAREEGRVMSQELELGASALKEMMKLLLCMTSSAEVEMHSNRTASGPSPAGTDSPRTDPSAAPSAENAPAALVIDMQKGNTADRPETKKSSPGDEAEDENQSLVSDENHEDPRGVSTQPNAIANEDASMENREQVQPFSKQGTIAGTPSAGSCLSAREVALNTLEEVFLREEYLEVPAMLAKDFDPRQHTFLHLANTIEIAFTFIATLLGDDFANLNVSKKRKRRKKPDAKKQGKVTSRDVKATGASPSEPEGNGSLPVGSEECEAENEVDGEAPNAGSLPKADPSANSAGSRMRTSTNDEDDGENDEDSSNDDEAEEEEERGNGKVDGQDGDIRPPQGSESDEPGDCDRDIKDDHLGNEGGSDDDSDDCLAEVVCEVEGKDVIRRFASTKALQHIALALRVALCDTAGVSSNVLPVPEGSGDMSSPGVVAKSLTVLRSVWKVVAERERGALRGTYYNYAMLHFLGVALGAAEKRKAPPTSILGSLGSFAREVIGEFYKVLAVNPAVLMDALFVSDLSVHRLYAGKMHKIALKREEETMGSRRSRLNASGKRFERDCESDEEENDSNAEEMPKRRKRKSAVRKKSGRARGDDKKGRMARRKALLSGREEQEEEDVDLDDLDNLKFGAREGANGEGADDDTTQMIQSQAPSRRSKQRMAKFIASSGEESSGDDDMSSADQSDDSTCARRRAGETRKPGKGTGESPAKRKRTSGGDGSKKARQRKLRKKADFAAQMASPAESSSDEYSSDDGEAFPQSKDDGGELKGDDALSTKQPDQDKSDVKAADEDAT